MNPVAFTIGNIDIYWYAIFISTGVLFALITGTIFLKQRGYSPEILYDLFLICFPIAIVGARIWYVIFNLDQYSSFGDMINIRAGGLAIHGGLVFGITSGFIYTKYKKLNFFDLLDCIVPGIILAQAIGRWGNFANMEAHGDIVSESFIDFFPEFIKNGMYIDGNYYHPTFLYESAWNILCFLILIVIFNKFRNKQGFTAAFYLILYSIGRFFIEGLRTDSLYFIGMRTAQLTSVVFIVLGLGYIIYYKKIHKQTL